jgi:hypothetical protein
VEELVLWMLWVFDIAFAWAIQGYPISRELQASFLACAALQVCKLEYDLLYSTTCICSLACRIRCRYLEVLMGTKHCQKGLHIWLDFGTYARDDSLCGPLLDICGL